MQKIRCPKTSCNICIGPWRFGCKGITWSACGASFPVIDWTCSRVRNRLFSKRYLGPATLATEATSRYQLSQAKKTIRLPKAAKNFSRFSLGNQSNLDTEALMQALQRLERGLTMPVVTDVGHGCVTEPWPKSPRLMKNAVLPEALAEQVLQAIDEKRFMISPHAFLLPLFQIEANDYQRYLTLMREQRAAADATDARRLLVAPAH